MTLEEKFEKFDKDNPAVWELFVKYTFQLIHVGKRNYSADAVVHRIRWETNLQTVADDGFKIANAHVAYYARKFHNDYPEHSGFFRTAELRSAA